MKLSVKVLFILFGIIAALLPAGAAVEAPQETRASHLGAVAVGVGKIMHIEDYLRENPGSRTAIFAYIKLDSPDFYPTIEYLKTNAIIQEKMHREFWPQVSLETSRLSLAEFRRELSRHGSLVDRNVRMLARTIAQFSDRNKWFFIRPFSEMNDATQTAPWEFGSRTHTNTPQDLASAWKLLRDTFDAEGATNVIFIFSPLAAYSVHKEDLVLSALNLIPAGYIDAFGLNVYSRPMTAYGGKTPDPISLSSLAMPWMRLLSRSKHHGIPLAVAEMGVSNQASDARRAQWLREAFKFTRSHGYVMVTYFNYPHRYWQINERTRAGEALSAGMNEVN